MNTFMKIASTLAIAVTISSAPISAAKGEKLDRTTFCMGGSVLVEAIATARDKGVDKSAALSFLSKQEIKGGAGPLIHLQAISATEFVYSLPGINPHDLSLISLGSCLAGGKPAATQKRKVIPHHAPEIIQQQPGIQVYVLR